MTTEELLDEAEKEAPKLKQLYQVPLRSKKARMLEYLARMCIDLPHDHADRRAYMQAILELSLPLLKQAFFKSRLPYTHIQLSDFMQDAAEEVIRLIDRYYDPHRGTFVSFVVMAGRQIVFKISRNENWLTANETYFSDGTGFDVDESTWCTAHQAAHIPNAPMLPAPAPRGSGLIKKPHFGKMPAARATTGYTDPVYTTVTGVSQLLLLVREFADRYAARIGHDPSVLRILRLLSLGPRNVTPPKISDLAKMFGVLPSEARRKLVTALVLFKVYAIGKGIESIKELEAWVPSR